MVLVTLAIAAPARAQPSARSYAHKLVLHRWHSEAEWRALNVIVRPESGMEPVRVLPVTTRLLVCGREQLRDSAGESVPGCVAWTACRDVARAGAVDRPVHLSEVRVAVAGARVPAVEGLVLT